ncbi:hypothetical protein [Solirubrum puertoriconensis]|uniref:Outer membrane protein beta-barrel domain-containing protein n=1 Tax=Solirubrum puertoriconensis TaxID=1751427 RepID=A0A9X0HKS7_SOLP1|nr:hypothetical protein [Solirubrum puertoriconensis]KUG07727.1 hypothetical protein ASU33_15530 [Solirubrum puertoriconensis]
MKRFLLAAALGAAGLLAPRPDAHAQRTDSTYVKPQLPTGPPMAPPRPQQPTRTTQPAPVLQQPQQQQPAQQAPPATPANPRGGIDDDGRPAQPLPGTPAPTQQPVQQAPTTAPASPRGGIDDDGRPAQTLPSSGAVPGATLEQKREPSKYFLYTNFSLGLNSNALGGTVFNVGASPAIGYRITPRIAIGPGVVYSFNNYSIPKRVASPGDPRNVSGHNIGGKIFGQVIVFKQFFVHAEYEVTRAELIGDYVVGNTVYVNKVETTVKTPLAGIGYRQQFGDRAAGDIAVLYNFNDGLEANIYGQPVIRFSFLFDLGK